MLEPVVSLSGLRIQGKERVLRALDVYATHPFLDFEDALIVAQLERVAGQHVMSYDRGFDRVATIVRREP